MIEQILLFFAGLFIEILATIDIQAVQRGQAFLSACATFILTFLGYTIFYNIITSSSAYWLITVFALGCGLGAFITIRWNKCKA